MANTAIIKVNFIALGRTRDDVVSAMDAVQMELQNVLGGAPWVVPDDDTVKKQGMGMILSDEQGFYYEGTRTIQFAGPFATMIDKEYHDGFMVQKFGEHE